MHKSVLLISILIVLYLLTRTDAKESFSGFKKYGNSNFRGGDIEQDMGAAGMAYYTFVDKKKDCANRCTAAEPKCKGFVVNNKKTSEGKWKCWLKDESAITGENRKEDSSKTAYITKGHYDYWTKDDRTKFSKKDPAPVVEAEGSVCTTNDQCTAPRICGSGGYCNEP